MKTAYFQPVAEMVAGPGTALLHEFLSAELGNRVCFVLVERPDARFTIVIEEQWAELALQLRSVDWSLPGDDDDDFTIPRRAIQAVIGDWPEHWDSEPSPFLSTHYSPDRIPHLSILGLDLRITS